MRTDDISGIYDGGIEIVAHCYIPTWENMRIYCTRGDSVGMEAVAATLRFIPSEPLLDLLPHCCSGFIFLCFMASWRRRRSQGTLWSAW